MGKNKHARDKSKVKEAKIPYSFTVRFPVSVCYFGVVGMFVHICLFLATLGQGINNGNVMTVKISYGFLVFAGLGAVILLYYGFYRITVEGEQITYFSLLRGYRKISVHDIGHAAFGNQSEVLHVYDKSGKQVFSVIAPMKNFVNFLVYLKKWNAV